MLMKKMLIATTMLCFCLKATAQVAVIEDKDGYTNVRQEPNGRSKVIHKINEGEVFFTGDETNGWTEVHFPPEDSGKFSVDLIRRGTLRGYVHSSRIRLLENMPKYAGDDCSFQMLTAPFSKEGKTIQYEGDDEKYVGGINHDSFWGTDGELPSVEVKALNISVNGKKIVVPANLLTDIYEVSNDFDCYKIGNTFMVHQQNSDGAGYYEICWVFDENGLQQRLVGSTH